MGARATSYNIQRVSATRPYVRFNPSFGPDKKTPAQQRINARAASLTSAIQTHTWTNALMDPINPYYWMIYGLLHNGDQDISNQNLIVNDRLLEQSVLIEHCLENAKTYRLASDLCVDASYDVRVDLVGVLSDDLGGSSFLSRLFTHSYGLAVATTEKGDDSLVTESNETFGFEKVVDNTVLLSLNISTAELIAALDQPFFFVRVGEDVAKIDTSVLLQSTQEKAFDQELENRFRIRLTLNKILPERVLLSENLTQPLGLNLGAVKNCARFMAALKADPELCLENLEIISPDGKTDIHDSPPYFVFYNGKFLYLSHSSVDRMKKKSSFADIMDAFYNEHYALNSNRLPSFKEIAFVESPFIGDFIVHCRLNIAALSNEAQSCLYAGNALNVRFSTEKVNIFAKEAQDLISNYEDEDFDPSKFLSAFEKFNNPYQVSALRIYVMAQKYYHDLFNELATYIHSEADLARIEDGFRTNPVSLRRVQEYFQ